MRDESGELPATDTRSGGTISDTFTEPDETRHSRLVSRRTLLKGSAAGLSTTLSGCSTLQDFQPIDNSESTPPYPETDGVTLSLQDVSLDEVSFQVGSFPRPYPKSYTITVYRKPVLTDESAKVQIGQSQFSTFPVPDTVTMDIDFTGEMDVAHQLIFTLQRNVDDEPREVYRTGRAILPFTNVAKGEEQVRVLGPTYISGSAWSVDRNATTKTEIWYNELDTPTFNVPKLNRSFYDQYQTNEGDDWFDLYNIQMTAIIRTPVLDREFKRTDDGDVEGPFNDWTVVTLELSAVEYLEALFWNSPPTMKLFNTSDPWEVGRGGFRNQEVENKQDYAGTVLLKDREYSEKHTSRVAQMAESPAFSFFRGIFHDELGRPETGPNDLRKNNPIRFAVGRGFSRRWAKRLSDAVEDKPYADTFQSMEYRKMTTLKAFVGDIDYDFTIGTYQASPEEVVIDSFIRNATDKSARGSDCVTSTMLFIGIAYWMTGKHPVVVRTTVNTGFYHVFAGFHNLDFPEALSESGGTALAGYSNYEKEPHQAREVDFGYTDVECTEPYSSIGYNRHTLDDSSRKLIAWSNLNELGLDTHIPMNDDWEPDIDGDVRATDNRWYRQFVYNPFEPDLFDGGENHIYKFEG